MNTDYDRCILSEKMRSPACKSCERCGWNRDELFRRKVLIRTVGLELNDRGLWQLRLRKAQ